MLKLKYLFDNRDLAKMLLDNWAFDVSSLEMLIDFRISANAIYPFKNADGICFLRFCPALEKPKDNIAAELAFIGHLRGEGYQALQPVPSKSGEELVQKSTPWGEYTASAFKCVAGKPVSETAFEDEILFKYGEVLGQLHKLSSAYTPQQHRRWTHEDVFDWIEATLRALAFNGAALDELKLLKVYFATLPKDQKNYGLIHYDFEPDNVFYDDATKTCSVIDFDDAMYHWYVMDVVQSLDSLEGEVTEAAFPQKRSIFLEGYRSRFEPDEALMQAMPAFRRFASLYGYARVARSVAETWENEPEWMVALRVKLSSFLARKSEEFGKTITSPLTG
jgi:Ser/Thr protein kinase RdoA (MazF antagonist)